jgi:FKBP-type peptidyl-prolyl cis-trans isomerase SlyD
MSIVIATGKVVGFHYTLTNDHGEVLDSSAGSTPLMYLHGSGNIVPGLEDALVGRGPGDNLKVVVQPEDGYGEKHGPGPQPVPRDAFPAGMAVEPGMQFAVEGPDGNPIPVWVTSVEDNAVHIDVNHPLAGSRLHFEVDVVSIRDATDAEREHGHPHGAGGHHH